MRDRLYKRSWHGKIDRGDIAETCATHSVFGNDVPFSAFKGYIGHTLAAAGALEAWISINMLNEGWFAPNLNLHEFRSENVAH